MTGPLSSEYGMWGLVVLNTAIFAMFAFTFFKPKTSIDWRSFGAFSAFLVALFTEMYGFPLTIYFLSGWLQKQYPEIDWFAHDSGHLLEMMFGWQSSPHFGLFHLVSGLLIGIGFIIISRAWRILYHAQKNLSIASTGPYAYVRHPQYVGFVLIMLGFLFQWPTILTVLMFPVLIWMYTRLAYIEEAEVRKSFGTAYTAYAEQVPGFIPRFGRTASSGV
ncbi:MAG: isoprenylcysteine carboxylmethyltransferase family protein [Alphaproteobacteria bacterium]|nr:isoprenylcysteine carboxylmethyltransferase family protein [Rhodospirillales bacterium]MCW9046248.1 isoprenylcysteine carboxylmethyltransferase family protein [Alphaproteobacteria bacterium]